MAKSIERRILDRVYGKTHGWAVMPHESPDFICYRDGSAILGVEVTEYYNSESEARLQNICGYERELITSREYRHKDDTTSLRVETITYLPGGDVAKGIKVDAIIHQLPKLNERLAKLSSIVISKGLRHVSYSENAPIVDLIIHDSRHAFRFENLADIYRPLSASDVRPIVIASPFREVFLVTLGSDGKPVCVPLKANAFAEEIIICEHLFLAQPYGEPNGLELVAFVHSLIDVLLNAGFKNTCLYLNDGEIHLRFSSIEFVYSRNGKLIKDLTHFPAESSMAATIENLAGDVTEEERGRASQIRESRNEYTACMDLCFPAHADL